MTNTRPADTVHSDSDTSRWREPWLSVVFFLTIVLVYWPSLSAEFIWDDDDYITNNLTLRSLFGLWQIWSDPRATPQYYPLVHTTFWVEYHIWGLRPLGYHLTNILLHAANVVLVAKVLQQLQVPGAWLAALVFGLHPVHVESVAWVTERKNVLSAFFYLLAMRELLKSWGFPGMTVTSVAAGIGSGLRQYLLGVSLFVAALLSKSITCSLPAVLLLIICQRSGRLTRRDVLRLSPLFVIGLVVAINTAWLERAHVGASGVGFQWTFAERVLIAGRALWFYAGKLAWPVNLAFMYPRWLLDTTDPFAWCVALSALLVPLLLAVRGRALTAPLVAVLFFGGTLLPALGFFNIYPMRYSYVADHFQYLASLGLIGLLVALATRGSSNLQAWLTSPRARSRFAIARWGMLALMLGALAGLTWQRQQAFQTPRALWTDTLAMNPGCMAAHIHLGRIAARAGNHVLAEKHYRDGLRLRTDDLETHEFETNLAVALAAQQRYPEAVEMFQAALARVPNYFEALNGLGNISAREGRLETAISFFERALAEQPHNGIVRRNLGTALSQTGQFEAAERELRRAAQDDPTSAPTQHTLAQILAMRGRLVEAEVAARAAVRLDPDFAPARKLIEQIERDPRRSRPLEPDR